MQVCPRPTVLVIDDSPESLTVLTSLLRPEYRVLAAMGGAEGLRVALAGPPPDLILLDVVMPTMDGYQVLQRLRASPSTRSTPMIFLTSLGDAEDEERGLALGAADYVTKPPRPAVLLARLRVQIEVKLMAVADVFDALTTARVYKAAMSCVEAREVIIAGRRQHFDPDVADAFLGVFDAFVRIAALHDEVAHPGSRGPPQAEVRVVG